MAYLRPPATKEGKRERSMVVVMAQTKPRDEGPIPVRRVAVSDQGKQIQYNP